jgi:glucose 1-dehydrogenase
MMRLTRLEGLRFRPFSAVMAAMHVAVEAERMSGRAGRLAGRNALVTGAGSGIGRAVAVRYAAEGANVAINDRDDTEALGETLRFMEAASAGVGVSARHRLAVADLADEAAVERMFAQLLGETHLDILINNAGIQAPTPGDNFNTGIYRQILDVNLTGAALCCRAAIAHFLGRGGGAIVNCTSVHEIIPKPGFLAYAISKSGLAALTRTLALEYADRGIRVNAVGPGATLTPMNAGWKDDAPARAAVEAHIPMRRSATPEEIAGAFVFLASDDAAYITGQTIHVCGGLTLFGDFQKAWD